MLAILASIGISHIKKYHKPSTQSPKKSIIHPNGTTTDHKASSQTTAGKEYAIIKSHSVPGIKKSYDIRLAKKVSKGKIRQIAYELKKSSSGSYKKIFICYYLPGMTVGAGAWASSHFTPNLETLILGLGKDKEQELLAEKNDPSRKTIGRWIADLGGAGIITIFRKDKKLFMERKFKDGSVYKHEFIEKKHLTLRRFEEKGSSAHGGYYLIDKKGNLQSWDAEGLIRTARKVK